MPDFLHLHNHTQYSLLDGASDIGAMMRKAKADGQKGVALTDHGNMFGAFKFVAEAQRNDVKPIIGCEFYMVEDRRIQSFSRAKGEKDIRYHQLMLAKNRIGYQNLSKLCSLGFIEGSYGKYPRIDKELILKYHEGLIATSCCLGAEIPQAFLHGEDEKAETLLKWWVDLLGDDYYIELQRHKGLEDIDGTGVSQEDINQKLLLLAKKYNVKTIVTNDSHYMEQEDADPHDILLCINTGNLLETEERFRFPSSDFYFKTQAEMNTLFADVPHAVDQTQEIYDKIDTLNLAHDILLPEFPIPNNFKNQEEYLRHITLEGARRRYGKIDASTQERLDFELNVIIQSGYSGYFLIVQDFTSTARDLGVAVGPGRGSAAGSVVAYCLGITNVDPIAYDLLFERFLNPERVSMPDIDIDFDDEGRQKVIDYVINKYGKNKVAQIVTYGTMAAKMSLRDVGRVLNIPLPEVDRVAKTFPTHLGATLKAVLAENDIAEKLKKSLNSDDLEKAQRFREMAAAPDDIGQMIRTAKKLEGSVRNTGIHACGVVITPDEITNFVPVKLDKNSDMLVTQFDNSVAEDAGLLKMDFLGLKTLTIIKDAVKMVAENHGVEMDIDEVPLEDAKTYELFKRGETIGIFQYESAGMQRYMKELAPEKFEDLIAMNALYRPGPLEYIPDYIDRRHGRKPVTYDLDDMAEILEETYGICVFQEQVMLLSQKLAGFSKGQADVLRKAMGKKKKKLIDELHPKFIAGGTERGYPEDKLNKIWKDWEAFASYAFNKSHSTCYAFIAFQTAYLKTHYPAEFMASVLTHNKNDLTKLTFFLRECRRMKLPVLGPSVNDSQSNFGVDKEGRIRFGLSALKGVGEGPVEAILEERKKNGEFITVFDMMRRLNLRSVNKKVMQSLVQGGGLDCFEGVTRSQYFSPTEKHDTFIELVLYYGQVYQVQKAEAENSLFGVVDEVLAPEPDIPECAPWNLIEKLSKEKDVTGIYISGHPLDNYEMELANYTNCQIEQLTQRVGQPIELGVIVSKVQHRINKKGNGWGLFTIQDYSGSFEFPLFGEDYQKYKHLLEESQTVYIKGSCQLRWGRDDEYQLKIKEVRMLEELGKHKTSGILLKLPVERVDADMINRMETLCKSRKGPHQLKIVLLDTNHRISLPMVSKSKKVQADGDFVKEVEALGLAYKLY